MAQSNKPPIEGKVELPRYGEVLKLSDSAGSTVSATTQGTPKRKLSTEDVDEMDKRTCERNMKLLRDRMENLDRADLELAENNFLEDQLLQKFGYRRWSPKTPLFNGKRNMTVQAVYKGEKVILKYDNQEYAPYRFTFEISGQKEPFSVPRWTEAFHFRSR